MINGGLDHARFLGTRRFGALDGLRAFSVLAVIWHHTGGAKSGLLDRGFFGVDMFFAISGFLITTLLLRERAATGGVSLRKFYVRRTLRIFPVYYLVLAAYVVLTLGTRRGSDEAEAFFGNLPAFLTYTSNWFVDLDEGTSVTFYFAWSLATEEQFYLFWPPLLALLFAWRRSVVPPIVALLALSALDLAVTHAVGGDALVWRIVSSLAFPILLGAVAALVLHAPRGFAAVAPWLGARASAPVAAGAVLALLALDAPAEAIQVAMVLLVAALCIREDTPLHGFLGLRPLVFVGTISYGMYLMHMLAANLVRPVLGVDGGWQVFAATVPVVVVAAYLSFRFFEQPILDLKRRFEVVRESAVDRRPAAEREPR